MSCLQARQAFYSPLCDTDTEAYLTFVKALSEYFNGHGLPVGSGHLVGDKFRITGGDCGSCGVIHSFDGGDGCGCEEETRVRGFSVRSVDGIDGGGVSSCFRCVPLVGSSTSRDGLCSSGLGCGVSGGVVSDVGSGDRDVVSGVEDSKDSVGFSATTVEPSVRVGGSFSVKVVGEKKKKMGKRQKDRAKARVVGGINSGDWRKPVEEPVVVVEKTEARLSLEEKWTVENRVSIAKAKLAEEKAKKDLEFQRARDVDAEVRKSRARIMRETESSKVATEKAFASLKASGNVPGFCATVVSDGPGLTDGSSPECTISPDSSASMHEFRAAQKQILDQQKEIKDLTRQLRLGKLMLGEEVTFTAKSDGDASEELTKALDELENERFYVDRSEDPTCFGVNKTIYAKRMYIDTHSYDGDY